MTTRRKREANPAPTDTETVGIRVSTARDEQDVSQKAIFERHEVDEKPVFETLEDLEASGQQYTSSSLLGGRECRTMSGVLLYRGM